MLTTQSIAAISRAAKHRIFTCHTLPRSLPSCYSQHTQQRYSHSSQRDTTESAISSIKDPRMRQIVESTLLFWENCKALVHQTRKYMQIRRETSAWSKHRVREANYRDVIFLRSAGSDLKRLIPFALVSLIPFSSLLLPGIIYFYPQFLPRIFYTDKLRERFRRERNEKRDHSAPLIHQYVTSAIVQKLTSLEAASEDENGDIVMVEQQLNMLKSLFEKHESELSLSIDLHQYVDMCEDVLHSLTRMVDSNNGDTANPGVVNSKERDTLHAFDLLFALRSLPSEVQSKLCLFSTFHSPWRLAGRYRYLIWHIVHRRKDDVLIDSFGVDNLSMDELRKTLHRRGFNLLPSKATEFTDRFMKDDAETANTLSELRRLMRAWIAFSDAVEKKFTQDTIISLLPGIITWTRSHGIYHDQSSNGN